MHGIDSKTIKIFIAGLMLFVVSCAAFVFVVLRTYDLQEQSAEVAGEIESRKKGHDQLHELERSVSESAELRERLDQYFLTGQDGIVHFLEEMETLGEIAGVTTDLTSVGEESGNDVRFILRFNATGSWTALRDLLALIETMPVKLSFSQMFLEKSGENEEGSEEWKLAATVSVESFIPQQ